MIGTSGAGKTTLAREITRRCGGTFIEIDALHWKADWQETPAEEMRARLRELVRAPSWTVDGTYMSLRDEVWPHADTIIWLDYSFPVVFGRVLRRTLRRVIFREELWNGNHESWREMFSRKSILWWVITTFHRRRRQIPQALSLPEFSHLQVFHFRAPSDAKRWLERFEEKPMSLKDELKEYYTVQELAGLLRVTDAAIEKLTHCGEIAHEVVDAAIHIPRHEVEQLLGKRRRVKIRRAGLAGLGVLAAVIGAGLAWQRRHSDPEGREDDE